MAKRDRPLILCVEDDGDVRDLLAYQLNSQFELVFAEDGKEGVRQAIYHRPDLILMDLMMPHMDGLEASGMIASVKALDCPVVALTAAPREVREKAQAAGFDLVLEKPVPDLAGKLADLIVPRPRKTSPQPD